MMNEYSLFLKDTRILTRHMLAALGIQLVVALFVWIGLPVMRDFPFLTDRMGSASLMAWEWVPKLQLAINCLVALIAAGFFMAEERAGNHDRFLYRLPIRVTRFYAEKLSAGLGVLAAAFVIQAMWVWVGSLLGARIWLPGEWSLPSLLIIPFCAYGIGVAFSLHLKQTIGVIVAGLLLVYGCMAVITGTLNSNEVNLAVWNLAILPVLALGCLGLSLALKRWRARIRPIEPISLATPLFFKAQKAQQWILWGGIGLVVASVGIVMMCLAVPPRAAMQEWKPWILMGSCVSILALLLSFLNGIVSYSGEEKGGVRHMIYHHPISLHRWFWKKYAYGAVLNMLPAFCMAALGSVLFLAGRHDVTSAVMNTPSQRLSLFLWIFVFSYIPYCSSMLATHFVKSPVYAFFEAGVFAVGVYIAFGVYQFSMTVPPMMYLDQVRWEPGLLNRVSLLPVLPWYLVLCLLGLAWAAWRMATDRHVLTGRTSTRHLAGLRMYLFVHAFVYIVMHIGWRDLWYLATGLDIGIG